MQAKKTKNQLKTVPRKNTLLKAFVALTFVLMVVVNALANILPINNKGTGEISDFYKNLFAPAGLTFAIWGVIYLTLALYSLYQFGLLSNKNKPLKEALIKKIGVYFSISSLANTLWIFSWHYQIIPLSMLLILVVLACLIMINRAIVKEKLNSNEQLYLGLPFSIYFGWITVAVIANFTTLLVSLSWKGFGISETIWTVIIILVGLIISAATIIRNRDFAYGLVIIWAYAGIWLKHTSTSGFAGAYPAVINTVVISIILLVVTEAFILIKPKK
ncbi:MAG: tryptophan-rich sensory protein [Clostridia bacterium]